VALVSLLVGLALASAVASSGALGLVIPSLLTDPFGCYSALHLPMWSPAPAPLHFPDRLVAIDGVAVGEASAAEPYRARRVYARLADLAHGGATSVTLRFGAGRKSTELRRSLHRIDATDVVWFWAVYALVGALIAWSGLVVLMVARRVAAARAYAVWSVAVFAFLVTFFDYHTTQRLVPIFSASTAWVGAGFLWLALSFPEPPPIGAARVRGIAAAIGACAVVLSVNLVALPRLGHDGLHARIAASLFAPLSALVLVFSLIARLWRSREDTRRQLRSSLVGMLTGPIFVFIAGMGSAAFGSTLIHVLIPLVMPLVPLSLGWALVRHNIMGANTVLTRRLLLFPVFALSLGAGLGTWLALRNGAPSGMWSLLPHVAFVGVFAASALGLRRFFSRLLFPAAAAFRPTILQLAESLTDLARRDDLRVAIEQTVSHWLPSGRVRLLDAGALDAIVHLPKDALGRLDAGERVWTDASPWERHLLVPMRSLGALRGVLDIAPKHEGALFTEEDVALLDTIASLGAIALHNAEVIDALDRARRIEVDATRDDKTLTLGLLGAELSHELAHPLQFFRGLVRRGARSRLDPDDVEIGEEELGRMERMLASLRSLEAPPPRSVAVLVGEPVERALVLLRDAMADKHVSHVIEVEGVAVIADPDGLVQVFANLLRNAVSAVAPRGVVGVHARRSPDGALTIDVWDDGPGVPEHFVASLFHRWVTSRAREGGAGLGLSVAQNLVNSFRWDIEYVRGGGRTTFRIEVPRECVVAASPPDAAGPTGRT